MLAAVQAVNEGLSLRKASRDFNVPLSTLSNKVKGKVPMTRKMGPQTILSKEEESLLVSWIHAYAKKGFPVKRQTLIETVGDVVKEDGRETPFTDGTPGRKWFSAFMKRHPSVSERHAESINAARARVTEKHIREWFEELRTYLESENALDILDNPSRIFNADESGFQTCPKTGRVLGPISFDNLYEIKTGNEKEAITVMANFIAAGETAPAMIVFPLQRIPRDVSENMDPNWGIARSRNGWMTGAIYFEYIANIFYPWLKARNIKFPVLLLVDGHKSHTTYNVAKYCSDHQILHFALLPNATHIL